jgi:hypothetical protein
MLWESTEESGKLEFIILDNNFYTSKYFIILRIFVESPEISNLIGAFPKADNSHGFPMYSTYEMYRDF